MVCVVCVVCVVWALGRALRMYDPGLMVPGLRGSVEGQTLRIEGPG